MSFDFHSCMTGLQGTELEVEQVNMHLSQDMFRLFLMNFSDLPVNKRIKAATDRRSANAQNATINT